MQKQPALYQGLVCHLTPVILTSCCCCYFERAMLNDCSAQSGRTDLMRRGGSAQMVWRSDLFLLLLLSLLLSLFYCFTKFCCTFAIKPSFFYYSIATNPVLLLYFYFTERLLGYSMMLHFFYHAIFTILNSLCHTILWFYIHHTKHILLLLYYFSAPCIVHVT